MQTPCDEKKKTPQSGLENGEDPPTPHLPPNTKPFRQCPGTQIFPKQCKVKAAAVDYIIRIEHAI